MNRTDPPSEASLIRAIESDPLDVRAYHVLAKHYAAIGKHRKAELTLRRAVEIAPVQSDSWKLLGIHYSDRGEWLQAADAFEQGAALDPGDLDAWVGYVTALIESRDSRRAAEASDNLLSRFPEAAASHLLAGHLAKVHGRVEEALAAYRYALRIDPDQTDAIFNIVDISAPELQDPLTVAVENIKRKIRLPPHQCANVSFALARIYERAGQVDRAFALYGDANAATEAMMRNGGGAYDPKQAEAERDAVIAMFGADSRALRLDPLDLDMQMIFVVGMPRSGTTLVEQILARHPRVSTAGELPFMQDCLLRLLAARRDGRKQGQLRLDAGDERQLLIELRERYLDAVFEQNLDNEYVIDKLPANFSAIGLIHVLFPGALVIHCMRDPVATCWSLYTAFFGTHVPYKTSFEHLVHHYKKIYLRMMIHWKGTLDREIVDVDYGTLTVTPEPAIRQLLAHCGLPWDDAYLDTEDHGQPIFTASMIQARRRIYATSDLRWKAFESHLQPLLSRLNEASDR